MKTIHKLITLLLLGASAMLVSCDQTQWEPLEGFPMEKQMTTTHTIQELVAEFFDSQANSDQEFTNPPTMSSDYEGNFKLNRIKSTTPVVIEGVVVSTDYAGNIYKYIVIQDVNDPTGPGLKISIDAGSLSGIYKYGQRLQVQCNDLVLGTYGQMIQLGTAIFNDDANRQRWDPGRIPSRMSEVFIAPYGALKPEMVQIPTMTIAEIKAYSNASAQERQKLFSRIVKIENVWFTEQGVDFNKPAAITADEEKIFAPSTNGIGFPQSRVIRDKDGQDTLDDPGWIVVATSEYARFANDRLPIKGSATSNKGNATCIIGWYKDKNRNAGNWQLTLRSKQDLEGFSYPQGEE